jgi:hypothetical protein
MEWLARTIARERRMLERARRRFVRKPSEKRLHDVRTTGRRLRSLLEDVLDLAAHRKLLRRIKRAAAVTDAARNAAILGALLEGSTDERERELARPLVDELRAREKEATERARRRLRAVRFS